MDPHDPVVAPDPFWGLLDRCAALPGADQGPAWRRWQSCTPAERARLRWWRFAHLRRLDREGPERHWLWGQIHAELCALKAAEGRA